jgi:hypothetical protein
VWWRPPAVVDEETGVEAVGFLAPQGILA